MAFTKGVFQIDAETGKAAVYLVDPTDPTDDAPFINPTGNRTRVLYHSDLDYLEIFYDEDVTLSLGSYAAGGAEIEHALERALGRVGNQISTSRRHSALLHGGGVARAPLQVAITEQAIRELFDRVVALEMKRGPGRPPKEAE